MSTSTNASPKCVTGVRAIVGLSVALAPLAGANAPPTTPTLLFIHSLLAPGYGSLSATQCKPRDLQCLAAVAQNAGPVPPTIVSNFKDHFPTNRFRFVDAEAEGVRTIVAAILRFTRADPFGNGPTCVVSGSISQAKDIPELTIKLDTSLSPPFGPEPEEVARRDAATSACLGAFADKIKS
jgi:hypothetical protein